MYANVYVLNALVRSISGRHKMTEEDYGLPPGTLPPEDLATLGNLITVDPKLLREPEKLRQRTNRILQNGVKVASGAVFTEAQLKPTLQELDDIRTEYERVIQKIADELEDSLKDRMNEYPEHSELIRKYAPDANYVKRRMSYDIDVFKLGVPAGDPHADVLQKTLQRSGNDISKRLVKEIAEFVTDFHKASFQTTQKLVKQSLGRLRDTLLPKIQNFALLDSSLRPLGVYLESFINDVVIAIDAKPKGSAWLDGADLAPFEQRIQRLMSTNEIAALMQSSSKSQGFASMTTPRADETAPAAPDARPLPKRPPDSVPAKNGTHSPRPIRF